MKILQDFDQSEMTWFTDRFASGKRHFDDGEYRDYFLVASFHKETPYPLFSYSVSSNGVDFYGVVNNPQDYTATVADDKETNIVFLDDPSVDGARELFGDAMVSVCTMSVAGQVFAVVLYETDVPELLFSSASKAHVTVFMQTMSVLYAMSKNTSL